MVFKNIIFQNRYVEVKTPPPFLEKNILNFHFDYLNISLSCPNDAEIKRRLTDSLSDKVTYWAGGAQRLMEKSILKFHFLPFP